MPRDRKAPSADRVVRFHKRAVNSTHVITYWRIESASTGKTLTCAGYQSTLGLELRVQYSDDEIVATKQFRGPGGWAEMEAYAAEARIAIGEHVLREGK